MDALPQPLIDQIKQGKIDLDDPATTLALIKLDAVLGVKGTFNPNGSREMSSWAGLQLIEFLIRYY